VPGAKNIAGQVPDSSGVITYRDRLLPKHTIRILVGIIYVVPTYKQIDVRELFSTEVLHDNGGAAVKLIHQKQGALS
jgi:hypothetical protein